MGQESGVAERDDARLRRFGVAPSASFGMNTPTRLTVSYFHIAENDTPDYGLPWLFNKVAKTPRRNYYGFPDANYLKTNDDIVTLRSDHDFKAGVNLHGIARWANYPRQVQITEPQICSSASSATSIPTNAANTTQLCPYTPYSDPQTIIVNRNQIQIKSVEGDLWAQGEVTARGKIAGVRNEFVGGAEGGQETSNPIKTSYTLAGVNTVPTTNLVHPNPGDAFAGTAYIASIVHAKAESVGLYFVDTVHLGRLFEASGGVRWDRFDTGYNSYQPVAPPAGGTVSAKALYSRVDAQPTYRAALVFKPNSHGSVYFDYGTSFNPSAESLALTLATQNAPPEENETYEVGTKWSFDAGHLLMEGAVFRTEKDNARETDPSNSNNVVVAGNQLVKGMQASLVARLPHGLDAILGYAYLDGKVIASLFYPNSIGNPLANVPTQTFNAFLTHNLPWRLNAGLGGNYVAARTASSTAPYVPTAFTATTVTATGLKAVPGYWVFNAMLQRPLTRRLQLQVNLYNALNRFYIDEPHPSHLIPGEGCNALFAVNYKF